MSLDKTSFYLNFLLIFLQVLITVSQNDQCKIPQNIHGSWFSREDGQNVNTEINSEEISQLGHCVDIHDEFHSNITLVLKARGRRCYYCARIFVRTLNVLQKIDTSCVSLNNGVQPSIKTVCEFLNPNEDLITLFARDVKPKNCRSSIEGVYRFAYQRQDSTIGECENQETVLSSCQTPGSQFLSINQQFFMNYRKCPGDIHSFDNDVQYACLGEWFIGKNQYFAVLNVKESRPEEKYRCFLRNQDDHTFMTQSVTAECNTLETPRIGPERLRLINKKKDVVHPKCVLPSNFTGQWVDPNKLNANIKITGGHMEIVWFTFLSRNVTEIYVCNEHRGDSYVMARLGYEGCQTDYVCFEFLPRHHNIIRFRKGRAMIHSDFHTVCSWSSFGNEIDWKYDLFILKNPPPVRCPVAGKFKFIQSGEIPFETRIRGGVTKAPRTDVICKENISDFSVCDQNQHNIAIDADYCVSVNEYGLPVDIYSEPDFVMTCAGFYQENLKSYLITYDSNDAFSPYRCWIYQRAALNQVLMSQSLGAFCDIRQNVISSNYTEGAAIALVMQEYEREFDDCPMRFDDGSNPWEIDRQALVDLEVGMDGPNAATNVEISSIISLTILICINLIW